jgi:uncharacterized 2Fe-2S/4Fe-4S cluster protein (DUF4445 family)
MRSQLMSVEITFAEDGGQGLVAEGTSLWEAGRRLGVELRADCNGRGECDSCAVVIAAGAEFLSLVNESEELRLGSQRLAAGERLACQARVARAGAVKVNVAPARPAAAREALRDLSLSQQVGAFIEVQATMMSEAVNTLRGKSDWLVEKFLNLNQPRANATGQPDVEANGPTKTN